MGARIRRRRQELGITQTELGRRAGVSKVWVCNVETGRNGRVRPSAVVVTRLAAALGVSLEDVLGIQASRGHVSIPPSLRAFAEEKSLPKVDVEMLAAISYRGQQPRDVDGWAFLYEAIRRSVAD